MQIRGGKLDYGNRNVKNKKLSKIILILILIVFVLILAIMGVIIYIQKNVLKVYVDGVSVRMPDGTIIINEENRKNIC